MAEHIHQLPSYHFTLKRMPADALAQNTVRCYRYSPDRVCLQIRGEKSYASVTLPFDVARALAEALTEECL